MPLRIFPQGPLDYSSTTNCESFIFPSTSTYAVYSLLNLSTRVAIRFSSLQTSISSFSYQISIFSPLCASPLKGRQLVDCPGGYFVGFHFLVNNEVLIAAAFSNPYSLARLSSAC